MNIFPDPKASARYFDGHIFVVLSSGQEISFPVVDNPRLAEGTTEQLGRIEISPFGLHWPDLDEDLSFRGLLAGEYGQLREPRLTRTGRNG